MNRVGQWIAVVVLVVGSGAAWAAAGDMHEGHEHGAMMEHQSTGQQTLTGEVIDVFCYLSHGEQGRGAQHAECARTCIQNGLPVAIDVDGQLYLASLADHEPANATLASYAGRRVTVTGQVMERDGQHFVAISHVEAAE